MKRSTLACLMSIALAHTAFVFAQESLVGTYTGNYTISDRPTGIDIIIDSIDNGAVKGTVKMGRRNKASACAGDYPIAGTYANNTLKIKSTEKSGVAGDCSINFTLTHEGNKLVSAKSGGRFVEVSK